MITTILFKEKTNTKLIESYGGKIINEFKHFPELLIAEITEDAINKLNNHDEVESVSVHNEDAESEFDGSELHAKYSNDTTSYVHHLNVLKATDYWERGITGKGVKVAVYDFVLGLHHNLDVAGQNNFGDSHNHTYNEGYMSYEDYRKHGTWCAGLITGKPVKDTATNITIDLFGGIAPDAELYFAKAGVLTHEIGFFSTIDWCIEEGIDIMSMSVGVSVANPQAINLAFKRAEEKGLIIVASSGNTNAEIASYSFPACSEYAVVISGLNEQLKRHTYNFGNQVTFSAPCRGVTSLAAMGTTENFINTAFHKGNGTSASTPLVAGVFALYKQMFPNKTKKELIEIMAKNAYKPNNTYWDKYVGYGLPQPPKELFSLPKIKKYKGINLNGNGDYIDSGNNESLNIKDNLTIITKVNQKSKNNAHIFAKTNSDNSKVYYGLKLNSTGLLVEWVEGTTQKSRNFVRSIQDFQDHEIAVVYDYPNIKLYIDGKEMIETFTLSSNMALSNNTDKLLIGGINNDSFAGIIYDTKIYNRSLSSDEILLNSKGSVSTQGLVLHYDFNGEEKDTVLDLSGNGNNGDIYGAKYNVRNSNKNTSFNKMIQTNDVTNLTATSTDHSIVLNWTHSNISSVGRKYDIYYLGENTVDKNIPILSTTSNTATITTLKSDTLHKYKVVTVDGNGISSKGQIIEKATLKDITNPATVTGLISAVGKTDVSIKWNNSASTDTSYYEVSVKDLSNSTFVLKNSKVLLNFALIDNLKPNTEYEISVISVDEAGNKSTSAISNIITETDYKVLHNDDFNRVDANTLGSLYTYDTTGTTMEVKSNQAMITATGGLYNGIHIPVRSANYALEIDYIAGGAVVLYLRRDNTSYQNSMFFYYSSAAKKAYLYSTVNSANSKYDEIYFGQLLRDGVMISDSEILAGDKIRAEMYSDGTVKIYAKNKLIFHIKTKDNMAFENKIGFSGLKDSIFDNFKVEEIPFYNLSTGGSSSNKNTIIAYDTFNRADTSGLGVSDSGHQWKVLGDSLDYFSIKDNKVTKGTAASGHATIETGISNNYKMSCDVTFDNPYELCLLPNFIDDGNLIQVGINPELTAISMKYKLNNQAWVEVGLASCSLTKGKTYEITVIVKDNHYSFLIDNVYYLKNVNLPNFSNGTKQGFRLGGASTYLNMDNFKVEEY